MNGPESRTNTKAFLEIRQVGEERVRFHQLTGSHQVVGRRPDAQIVLNHSSVSRSHAELVMGPFGRWWIHDLGSKNGTYVNGTPAAERLLNPGDGVRIGEFTLRLRSSSVPEFRSPLMETPSSSRMRSAAITESDEPTAVFNLPPSSLRGAPQISAAHLTTVMALSRELMRVEDWALRIYTLCEFVVGDDFPANSAAVVRLEPGRTPQVICGPQHHDRTDRSLHFVPRVLKQLWETHEPVLASNTEISGNIDRPGDIRDVAVVAVPLISTEQRIDALYLEFPERYGSNEWLNLVALVAEAFLQAELVWDMRTQARQGAFIERELDMARQIQEGLIPRAFELEGLELAIGFEPCRWVGGDYVDSMALPDGRMLLAIADVCGKGMQAALVASSLHTLVRATADTGRPLADLMRRINDYLLSYLPEHSFVTMTCVALDCHTGELEVISAGHPAAFVVRPDGSLRCLQQNENVGLGMIQSTFLPEHSVLAQDDVLLLFTDGLTEMEDQRREPLGADRLGMGFSQIVAINPSATVSSMRERLIEMCRAYRGSGLAADDSTFLVARRRLTLRPPLS